MKSLVWFVLAMLLTGVTKNILILSLSPLSNVGGSVIIIFIIRLIGYMIVGCNFTLSISQP